MADQDLTAARARELYRYDPETGVLYRKHAYGERVGKAKANGYLVVGIGGKTYQVHRVIWLIVNGKWPAGDVDHVNRIKTDNRYSNLRDVSHSVNARNQARVKSKTQLIGPIQEDGKWIVILPHYLTTKRAGPFDTHAEAHDYFAERMRWDAGNEGKKEPKLRI